METTHHDIPDEEFLRDNPCPVCKQPMYAVQVEQGVYALPCGHWLYQGRTPEEEGSPP